ncbi:variable surface lipoprotein [Mycoplasmopsis californica]|nr:variable surface lipoprotein [Mycoplasmopsis californica]
MKNKFWISLGGVLSTTVAVPLLAASCGKTESQSRVKLVATSTELANQTVPNKNNDNRATYKDLLFDESEVKLEFTNTKINDDILTSKKDNGLQVFFNSYNNVVALYGTKKTPEQKPWEAPKIATISGLDSYLLTNDKEPIYIKKDKKKPDKHYLNNNGYLNVTKNDAGKYVVKFRLFKKEAKGAVSISTQIYEMVLN